MKSWKKLDFVLFFLLSVEVQDFLIQFFANLSHFQLCVSATLLIFNYLIYLFKIFFVKDGNVFLRSVSL